MASRGIIWRLPSIAPKYRNPALLSILRRNAGSSSKHSTLPITTPSIVSSVISKYFERVFLLKRYSSIKEVNISEIYFFYHICALISTCIIYNIACNKCPYVKGTLYTLLLLSSIFRAIITFPIYVYQMLQNLDASSRFMIDERKLGLLFWNTFRLSKKAALFSVFISEKVASSF